MQFSQHKASSIPSKTIHHNYWEQNQENQIMSPATN